MAKNNAPKGFLLYGSYLKQLSRLSEEEVGRLIIALLKTFNYGDEEPEDFGGALSMAYSFIAEQMDRDVESYREISEQRKSNGSKGGRPKKDENQENHMVIEKTSGFSENHMVSEKPNVKVKAIVNTKAKATAIANAMSADADGTAFAEMPAAAAEFEKEIADYEKEQDFKRVAEAFEKALGRMLSTFQTDELQSYLEMGMQPDVLIEAARKVDDAERDKHNWLYVRGILRSWSKNKIFTLDDVRREDAEFERQKQEWQKQKAGSGRAAPKNGTYADNPAFQAAPIYIPPDERRELEIAQGRGDDKP